MMYHRHNNNEASPANDADYCMFAADEHACAHYGAVHWVFDGEAVAAGDVIQAAIESGFEDEFYEAELINPRAIVDTAGAWDDYSAVAWLWENVLEPRGWYAVATNDGCVVFDVDAIRRAG